MPKAKPRKYLRGTFGGDLGNLIDRARNQGSTPYAEWVGSRSSGYLWCGADDEGCFFWMNHDQAVSLARFILESTGNAVPKR